MLNIVFLLILLLSPVYISKADATPKFYNKIEFEFKDSKNREILNLDSIVIFANPYDDTLTLDTLYFSKKRKSYGDNTLDIFQNKFVLTERHDVTFFKVIIFVKGVKYQSAWIINKGQRNLYCFKTDDFYDVLRDESSWFYVSPREYVLALLLTILLEGLFLVYINRKADIPFQSLLMVVLVMNIVSHPLLWWMHSHTEINIILLEVAVMFLESAIFFVAFASKYPYTKFLRWSFIANLISWWLGGILIFVLITTF